jgi:hypothetical protein
VLASRRMAERLSLACRRQPAVKSVLEPVCRPIRGQRPCQPPRPLSSSSKLVVDPACNRLVGCKWGASTKHAHILELLIVKITEQNLSRVVFSLSKRANSPSHKAELISSGERSLVVRRRPASRRLQKADMRALTLYEYMNGHHRERCISSRVPSSSYIQIDAAIGTCNNECSSEASAHMDVSINRSVCFHQRAPCMQQEKDSCANAPVD